MSRPVAKTSRQHGRIFKSVRADNLGEQDAIDGAAPLLRHFERHLREYYQATVRTGSADAATGTAAG